MSVCCQDASSCDGKIPMKNMEIPVTWISCYENCGWKDKVAQLIYCPEVFLKMHLWWVRLQTRKLDRKERVPWRETQYVLVKIAIYTHIYFKVNIEQLFTQNSNLLLLIEMKLCVFLSHWDVISVYTMLAQLILSVMFSFCQFSQWTNCVKWSIQAQQCFMYYILPLPDPVSLHTTFLQSSTQICCRGRKAQINFPCFDKLLYIAGGQLL